MQITLKNLNHYLSDNLYELIHHGIFQDKEIILFGANSTSHLMKKILSECGYGIAAYIDNDRIKCQDINQFLQFTLAHHTNTSVNLDHLVYAYMPEEYLGEYRESAVILIASKYYPQMSRQLYDMGYEEGKQVFQIVDFYALEQMLQGEDMNSYCKLQMGEVREMQMELMRYVRDTCERNGLRYYMCGGTLLGAVRHGGYIPWDDDVDLAMPMPDYLKFIKIVKNQGQYLSLNIFDYPDDYYNFFMRLINQDTYLKYWEYPFLMTTGVSIDIFPLFGLPSQQKEREFFYKTIRLLNERYISTYIENDKDTQKVISTRHNLQRQIEDMMEQYSFDECEWIGNVLSKYREKEIMPRAIYQDYVHLKFENDLFAAAGGYVDYLSRMFGDYMQLPPERDRMNTHDYNAYVVNKVE